MSTRLAIAAILAVALTALAAPARAAPLVVDLSKHLVAITTGFAGTDVLMFGAIDGEGDVVVIVRGPSRPAIMHRKSRILGVWANTATMTFDRAPSFYAVAASRPLEEIAAEPLLRRHEIGLAHLEPYLPRAKASENLAREWKDGLKRNQVRLGLYREKVGRVSFLGNQLFRAEFDLPANVPTGSYQVHVYLLRDGRVVSAQTTPLRVDKVGVEAEVFDFAHRHAAVYGIVAILVALMAGWLGNVAFRRS